MEPHKRRQLPNEILCDILKFLNNDQYFELCQLVPEIKKFSAQCHIVFYQETPLLHKFMAYKRITDQVYYVKLNNSYDPYQPETTLNVFSFTKKVQRILRRITERGCSFLFIEFLFDTSSTSIYHTFELYRFLGPMLVDHPHDVHMVKYNLDAKKLTKSKDERIGVFEFNLYTVINYDRYLKLTHINCAETLFRTSPDENDDEFDVCYDEDESEFVPGLLRSCMFLEPDRTRDATERLKLDLICDVSKSALRRVQVLLINDAETSDKKKFHNDWNAKKLDFEALFNPKKQYTDNLDANQNSNDEIVLEDKLVKNMMSTWKSTISDFINETHELLTDPSKLVFNCVRFLAPCKYLLSPLYHPNTKSINQFVKRKLKPINVKNVTPENFYEQIKEIREEQKHYVYQYYLRKYTDEMLRTADFGSLEDKIWGFIEEVEDMHHDIAMKLPEISAALFDKLADMNQEYETFKQQNNLEVKYSHLQRELFKQLEHEIPDLRSLCDLMAHIYNHGYNNNTTALYSEWFTRTVKEYQTDPRISLRLDQEIYAMCVCHKLVDLDGIAHPPDTTVIRLLNDYSEDSIRNRRRVPKVTREVYSPRLGVLRSEKMFLRPWVRFEQFH